MVNNKEAIKENKPLVAIYGIYKNEQTFIERFLNSVKTADQVVLCDTGSTDDTNDIIKKLLKNTLILNLRFIRYMFLLGDLMMHEILLSHY